MSRKSMLLLWLHFFLSVGCTIKKNDNYENNKSLESNLKKGEEVVRNSLKRFSSILIENRRSTGIYNLDKTLSVNKSGVLSNFDKSMKSNIYITKEVKLNSDIRWFGAVTDYLEKSWIDEKMKNNNFLAWLYAYHVGSNTMRIYPWVDMSQVVGSSIKWSLVTFFENKENLEQYKDQEICTRPYEDLGGTGANISCCSIITDENLDVSKTILSCVDLSLKDILDKYHDILIKTKQVDNKSIIIESSAPSIAYKKFMVANLSNNKREYVDNLEKLESLELIAESKYLNLKVYIKYDK